EPFALKPIRTVDDAIDLVLHRHLNLARGSEELQKKKRESQLPLIPRSSFNITNDRNHPGPEVGAGTDGFQSGIRDLVLYPLLHTENSPNSVDSLSQSSRPSDRIKDLFEGGIEFHSRNQQAEYKALRLKQDAEFKAKSPELLQKPAENFVQDAVDQ